VRNNTNVYIIFLQLSVFLLMKHTFDVIYGTEEYPFSVFTVKMLFLLIIQSLKSLMLF